MGGNTTSIFGIIVRISSSIIVVSAGFRSRLEVSKKANLCWRDWSHGNWYDPASFHHYDSNGDKSAQLQAFFANLSASKLLLDLLQ